MIGTKHRAAFLQQLSFLSCLHALYTAYFFQDDFAASMAAKMSSYIDKKCCRRVRPTRYAPARL